MPALHRARLSIRASRARAETALWNPRGDPIPPRLDRPARFEVGGAFSRRAPSEAPALIPLGSPEPGPRSCARPLHPRPVGRDRHGRGAAGHEHSHAPGRATPVHSGRSARPRPPARQLRSPARSLRVAGFPASSGRQARGHRARGLPRRRLPRLRLAQGRAPGPAASWRRRRARRRLTPPCSLAAHPPSGSSWHRRDTLGTRLRRRGADCSEGARTAPTPARFPQR